MVQSKTRYKAWATACLFGSALSVASAANNLWSMHTFDKYIIKPIEIAANVPSVGSSSSTDLSMEKSLQEAKGNVGVSRLENPAIIWKTPYTSVHTLEEVLDKAVKRTQQIQQFKLSFETKEVREEFPQWVKDAQARLNPQSIFSGLDAQQQKAMSGFMPTLKELSQSEYGQRIGSEYEALNSVVGGGTRTTGKNLDETHRSLLDTLDTAAGWRSIIRFQADDYKQAHAHVFVGYLKANMGYLDESLNNFKEAKNLMDQYPDDKNLSIFRNTPELEQRTIKGLINSSIEELKMLNQDTAKYSTGWWKRLRYYNQSIGGQANPSIQDMAEAINDRYLSRAKWMGVLALGFLYLAGRNAKKLRLTKEYEVKHETG